MVAAPDQDLLQRIGSVAYEGVRRSSESLIRMLQEMLLCILLEKGLKETASALLLLQK